MLLNESLYATCASGLQKLLAAELIELGAQDVSTAGAGVRFGGGLKIAYEACLWSRVANRILLPIHSGNAATPEALYELVKEVDWSAHMALQSTLAVDFFTANSAITHSQYGALKVKDAVVDQFRERTGERPNVERETPDLRINVYLYRNKARIAVDLSGSSLHRRGYREQAGPAPVKENLAASLLLACDWPARAERGEAFNDPLCGSGTLVIEAAMIANKIAPGLRRTHFGFTGWLGHDQQMWNSVLSKAQASVIDTPCELNGADTDRRAIALAIDNAKLAGVEASVNFRQEDVLAGGVASASSTGLVLTNPPYGERLDVDAQFYENLGTALSRQFAGWHCGLFTALTAPVRQLRLPMTSTLPARNGSIECALFEGRIPSVSASGLASVRATSLNASTSVKASSDDYSDINESSVETESVWANAKANRRHGKQSESRQTFGEQALSEPAETLSVDVEPFVNRIRKNLKRLKSWHKREQITAWRIYDADLPEFAVAIDIYECEKDGTVDRQVVVQEYQAPATVNSAMAQARLQAVLTAIPESLAVDAQKLHLKVREKQAGLSQYEKQSASKVTGLIREHGYLLECNFTDYLDTGVFLDHRKIRRFIQQKAGGQRFLNLFSYTGSATIAAVSGGAQSSVSVDLSNRYSQWLTRNLRHNHMSESTNEVVRSDVNLWLDNYKGQGFDMILLDPPTFSNSTGIDADWNVQRDHATCVRKCMSLLEPEGILVFSNNYRRFKMDRSLGVVIEEKKRSKKTEQAVPANTDNGVAQKSDRVSDHDERFRIEERSYWSIDNDFQRNARIHQCWFITHQ